MYYNNYVKEPQITNVVTEIADTVGAEMFGLQYRVKSIGRYLEKFEKDLQKTGKTPVIKDVVRYTLVGTVENIVDITLQTFDELEKRGYETITVKNFWVNGNGTYKGVNTFVRTP